MRLRRGTTFIELAIATAILGSVIAIVAESLGNGSRCSATLRSATDADALAHRLVSRIADELRQSQAVGTIVDAAELQFSVCTGLDATTAAALFGEARAWRYDRPQQRLLRVRDPGTATEAVEVVAIELPDQPTMFAYDAARDQYTIAIATRYLDADGGVHDRTVSSRVCRRTTLTPDGSLGGASGVLPGDGGTDAGTGTGGTTTAGTTTGGTTTGTTTAGTTTGGTTTAGTTTAGTTGTTTGGTSTGGTTAGIAVEPTVHLALLRSSGGKDLTGTVTATVIGDVVTGLTVGEDADVGDNAGAPIGLGTGEAHVDLALTGVGGRPVTVTATATTASGGTLTVSRLAAPGGGIAY